MTAKIKLNAASGGGSVSLKAPSTTTSNAAVELQLPVADGSAGQFMKTDGSGNLAFAAAGGGKVIAQKFVSSSTNEQVPSGNQTFTLVGPQITHTAASTSNKLVFFHNHHLMVEGAMDWMMAFFRDGLSGAEVYRMVTYTQLSANWSAATGITSVTATPPDTSSHTYQFAIYRSGGANNLLRYSPNAGSTGSQIMMLEVEP